MYATCVGIVSIKNPIWIVTAPQCMPNAPHFNASTAACNSPVGAHCAHTCRAFTLVSDAMNVPYAKERLLPLESSRSMLQPHTLVIYGTDHLLRKAHHLDQAPALPAGRVVPELLRPRPITRPVFSVCKPII